MIELNILMEFVVEYLWSYSGLRIFWMSEMFTSTQSTRERMGEVQNKPKQNVHTHRERIIQPRKCMGYDKRMFALKVGSST